MSDMEGVHKVCKIIPHEEIYNAENQSQSIHQAVGDDFLLAGPVGDSKINNYIFLRIGLNFFVCFECDNFDDLGFEV